MAKFIIVFCAFIACAVAKPGLVAPLAYSAPLLAAAQSPLVYSAPLAYANAHLDAAYASSRVDIKQNYNAALVPTTLAAAAPVATPLKYTAAAPLAYAAAPLAYAAAPLAYANAHLDAAYASNRVDIKQNYNAAVFPHTYAAVAPVATPLKYTAATPVLL